MNRNVKYVTDSISQKPYFPKSKTQSLDFVLYKGNSIELMQSIPDDSIDLIFSDPPYFLSNGGITCHAGRMVSVNKGKWDESKGIEAKGEW